MCEYPAFCLDVRESLTYSSYDHTSLPAGSEEQPWRTTLGHQLGTSAACTAQLACRRAIAVVAHRAIATTDSPHSELRAFHRSPTRSSSRCSTAPRGAGWSTGPSCAATPLVLCCGPGWSLAAAPTRSS